MLIDLTSLEVTYLMQGLEKVVHSFEDKIKYAKELSKKDPELAKFYLKDLMDELKFVKKLSEKLSAYTHGNEHVG